VSDATPSGEVKWWQQPYQGGPMVKVAGFPRPLYPPDATAYNKRPSVDGPDVEAYKRTVSRAGRWPWQAFDDSFSNGFSHGKGTNVRDTGIAGIQLQQHLDATGWVGEATFNTLRSIKIPAGLPHAGEMAMDAYAASLIDEAFDCFGGSEPTPESASASLRETALGIAIEELGYHESPSGSNLNKYGDWYGTNGQPWCAMFVTWAIVNAADELATDAGAFERAVRYSYVPYIVADARAGHYGLSTTDDPIPGDIVCYDWQWDTVYDHVGLFEYWLDGTSFSAIEGNTSAGSNSNGGEVQRRERTRSGQGTVFVHAQQ
jgi:hypothetical protein